MRDACHFVAGALAVLVYWTLSTGGSTSVAAAMTVGLIVALAIPRTVK